MGCGIGPGRQRMWGTLSEWGRRPSHAPAHPEGHRVTGSPVLGDRTCPLTVARPALSRSTALLALERPPHPTAIPDPSLAWGPKPERVGEGPGGTELGSLNCSLGDF